MRSTRNLTEIIAAMRSTSEILRHASSNKNGFEKIFAPAGVGGMAEPKNYTNEQKDELMTMVKTMISMNNAMKHKMALFCLLLLPKACSRPKFVLTKYN